MRLIASTEYQVTPAKRRGRQEKVRVTVSIKDPVVNAHTLNHWKKKEGLKASLQLHEHPKKRGLLALKLLD